MQPRWALHSPLPHLQLGEGTSRMERVLLELFCSDDLYVVRETPMPRHFFCPKLSVYVVPQIWSATPPIPTFSATGLTPSVGSSLNAGIYVGDPPTTPQPLFLGPLGEPHRPFSHLPPPPGTGSSCPTTRPPSSANTTSSRQRR
jgi:hypothetical protein